MKNIMHLKSSIPPVVFYAAELRQFHPSRQTGWVDGGLCPFHDDRRPGSFYVNLDSGAFTCFSCGAKGGDTIAFVMQRYELTFPEAVEYLSQRWGVSV